MTDHLHQLAKQAKEAARQLALYDTEQKNRALLAIAQALEDNIPAILAANARDVESAQENGVRPTMIDRLRLDEGRVRSMAEGARQVAQLPDPTGNVLETIHRPNGMVIEKVSVPIEIDLLPGRGGFVGFGAPAVLQPGEGGQGIAGNIQRPALGFEGGHDKA